MDQLAPVVARELAPLLDRPYVFYGHCVGGTVAFEVAREIRRAGGRHPSHIFIGGMHAPQIPWPYAPIRSLPELDFLHEVQRRYSGIPPETLANAELRALVIPALRADVAVAETYEYVSEEPLDCGITTFGGTADPMVSPASLAEWRQQTRGIARTQLLEGNHFFLQSAQGQLLEALDAEIRQVLDRLERGRRIAVAEDFVLMGPSKPASPETVACPPGVVVEDAPGPLVRPVNGRMNGAPVDPMERTLAGWWEDLLGVTGIGSHDDFFDLGGHSLLGVRLLTRIEREWNQSIPVHVLFETRTIQKLARYLRGDTRRQVQTIVPINTIGNGPVFYCVHSLGGETSCFRDLAKALGPAYNFYGVQKAAQAPSPFSIESLARVYVKDLLAEREEGPYILGGWSAGAVIALEMARQLNMVGKKVELIVALDGAPCNTGSGTPRWSPAYYWKLLHNLPFWIADDLLVDFSGRRLLCRAWNKGMAAGRRLANARRGGSKSQTADISSFFDISGYSHKNIDFMNALFAALDRYIPERYGGKVLVYQARTEPLHHLFEVDRAWRAVAAEVDVVRVPGTHLSLVRDPYVRVIADDLRRRLDTFCGQRFTPACRSLPANE